MKAEITAMVGGVAGGMYAIAEGMIQGVQAVTHVTLPDAVRAWWPLIAAVSGGFIAWGDLRARMKRNEESIASLRQVPERLSSIESTLELIVDGRINHSSRRHQ